jgi:flagellar hook-associated protein 1 FlgK
MSGGVSTFYGMQTALRGLLAEQRSIDVTGHNIANVGTAGYTRQEAVLRASPAGQVTTGSGQPGHLGAGVDVTAYQRVRNSFLDVQYRAQSMQLGYATQTATTLGDAELTLNEPSDAGLSAQLSSFWDSWSDLAKYPEDATARQTLVQQGASLAGSFKSIDSQLAALQTQATGEYATLTAANGQVATIAKEIGQLNGSIATMVQVGDAPNDLLDRRDLLIDQLSALAQVSVTQQDNGSVTIGFGDAATPLVDGTTVTWPQALGTPGGKLGALKDLGAAGGKLDAYRTQLSSVAQTLADTVNAVHGSPPFFSYTPGSAATSLAVNVTASQITATTSANAGANEVAIAVSALRSGAADTAYRGFVTGMGSDVDGANRAQANADALTSAVDDRRQSTSGVSLDEEMTNLVRFQRAYQASARAMSTMDDMLDQLINRTGRVGL